MPQEKSVIELLQNAIVRQGFVAALLKVDPETVAETTLLPTMLSQEGEMETARTASPYLPGRVPHLKIASRLAARCGKKAEDFENMAEKNSYIRIPIFIRNLFSQIFDSFHAVNCICKLCYVDGCIAFII
ncbi:MAG: hypothetical protein LUF30_04640 [Lachnospiraceae bacterium]|nr:hypothetical protein [Lachnospiraceae bacterium]